MLVWLASLTNLPVIGVPVKTSTMSGLDSLYSIVQMPRGVPVATMAINGSKNAALLSIKILATNDKTLSKKLTDYSKGMYKDVIESERLISNMIWRWINNYFLIYQSYFFILEGYY